MLGFKGVRFQSPSSTTQALHHALTKRIGSTQCVQRLVTTYRAAPFHGHALWLELSRDPARLPSLVPSAPDFSLHPCRITTTSSTHHRGTCQTLPSLPCSGFSPVRHIQGCPSYLGARFDVAQHHLIRATAPPVPKSRRAATCEGVEAGNHTPQRSSYAAPALLEARGFRQCPRVRLTTVEAPFPGGVELGGAQSGVTVCVCGGWRPPQQTHPGVCGVASPLFA